MSVDIPEGGWPSIKVVAPRGGSVLEGSFVEKVKPPLAAQLMKFYRETLVPQLACRPDGGFPALPSASYLCTVSAALVRRDGVLVGSWVLDADSQLLYPCAELDDVAGIFRALWDVTITRRDYVWGSTTNPTIMAFASAAVRTPPSENSPTISGERIEWRKP